MLVYINVYRILVCWCFTDTLRLLRIFEYLGVFRYPFGFRKDEQKFYLNISPLLLSLTYDDLAQDRDRWRALVYR